MELRKNRFIFGFANGQPLLYISIVENCIQKKVPSSRTTLSVFSLLQDFIGGSYQHPCALSLPSCAIHSVSMTSCHGSVSPCFLSSCSQGVRVSHRFWKPLLAIINPIGRFIESYVVLSTFIASLRLMHRSPRLLIDNIIAFVPFSAHSIVPCNFLVTRRNPTRLDFFCGWHPLPSHHRPRCAIPCQRDRVVHTGLEPVITTLKEW